MVRRLLAFAVAALLLSCTPEASPQGCEGAADFKVTLTSPTDTFPSNTEIKVTFGGGSTEAYALDGLNDPEVLFCEIQTAPGPSTGAGGSMEAGAGGAPSSTGGWLHGGSTSMNVSGGAGGFSSRAVHSITCEIWSGGPATISIRAGAWHTTRDLKTDPDECTTNEAVVLGEPDPKP